MVFLPLVMVLKISPSAILRMRSSCKVATVASRTLGDAIAGRRRTVADGAVDIETLLAALHELFRDRNRNARSPVVPHLAGVVIIRAVAETDTSAFCSRRRSIGRISRRRFQLRHWWFVANRHRARDRQADPRPSAKKSTAPAPALSAGAPCPGKFPMGARATSPRKPQIATMTTPASTKMRRKRAAFQSSSCITVMCWPPVSSSSSRVSISVKRGSRASMTRKKPSLVTRLKRSQLNIG